jgi:hypothetical protein
MTSPFIASDANVIYSQAEFNQTSPMGGTGGQDMAETPMSRPRELTRLNHTHISEMGTSTPPNSTASPLGRPARSMLNTQADRRSL